MKIKSFLSDPRPADAYATRGYKIFEPEQLCGVNGAPYRRRLLGRRQASSFDVAPAARCRHAVRPGSQLPAVCMIHCAHQHMAGVADSMTAHHVTEQLGSLV